MNNGRKDGKIAVSFRIRSDIELALHKYCAWRADRIAKSNLVEQLIFNFLRSQGVEIDTSSKEKPEA